MATLILLPNGDLQLRGGVFSSILRLARAIGERGQGLEDCDATAVARAAAARLHGAIDTGEIPYSDEQPVALARGLSTSVYDLAINTGDYDHRALGLSPGESDDLLDLALELEEIRDAQSTLARFTA